MSDSRERKFTVDDELEFQEWWRKRGAPVDGRGPFLELSEPAVKRLFFALRDLYDVQNGSPLETYTNAWNDAMEDAAQAMGLPVEERELSPYRPTERSAQRMRERAPK